MNNIWLNGIMGVVVGDALGVPVEFSSRGELKINPLTKMEGYGSYDVPEGTWSDDSSMMLATLDSLKNGYNPVDIMEKFAEWLVDGKYTPFGEAFDVGRTCLKAIMGYLKNPDITKCGGTGEHDNGNGSLMRILPICLYMYEKQKEELKSENEEKQKVIENQDKKINTLYNFLIQLCNIIPNKKVKELGKELNNEKAIDSKAKEE